MYLITPTEVVEHAFSPLEAITAEAIRPSKILVAQERFIRPVFGDRMYQTMLGNGHGSFIESYLKPALAHYVRQGMIDELAVRVSDKGVGVYSSEDTLQTRQGSKTDNLTRNATAEERTSRASNETKSVSDTRTVTVEAENAASVLTTESDERKVSGEESTMATNFETTNAKITQTTQQTSDTMTKLDKTDNKTVSGDDQKEVTTTETITDTGNTNRTDSETRHQDTTDASTVHTTTGGTSTADGTKVNSATESKQVEDAGNANTKRFRLQSASREQCRTLAQRALRDARMLMRRAVYYVEAHPESFPEYEPLQEKSCHRRYIGGVVL